MFDGSNIRDFFEERWQEVFTDISISHKNIHKGFAFRNKVYQNLPSVEIITQSGNANYSGRAREPQTNITSAAVKRLWERSQTVQMRVVSNPKSSIDNNYIDRLVSLFYRTLTTQQFDVGSDSSPVSSDADQKRVAFMDNFSENFEVITDSAGSKVAAEICIITVAVSYYEYEVN